MNKTLTLTLLTLALCLTSTFDQVRAQARYDDHELRDRFRITLGGFGTNNTSTKIRIDSNNRVLGTLIDLEDGLNVEDSATVARLDGFYRFNRAHRIEWTAYSLTRNGRKTLNTSRTIGGTVYPVGFSLDSEWKLNINKVGYSWSFINVDKYEIFLGAGLNVHDLSLNFTGTGLVAGQVRTYDGDGSLPLPTFTAGLRYNILDKLAVRFRFENFFLEIGDSKGRMQDSYLLLDYDFTKNFGIGGGLNAYTFDVSSKKDDFTGEIESSYLGLLLYFTASF